MDIMLNPAVKLVVRRKQMDTKVGIYDYVEVWLYQQDAKGSFQPTGRGIRVPVQHVDELISCPQKAKEDRWR